MKAAARFLRDLWRRAPRRGVVLAVLVLAVGVSAIALATVGSDGDEPVEVAVGGDADVSTSTTRSTTSTTRRSTTTTEAETTTSTAPATTGPTTVFLPPSTEAPPATTMPPPPSSTTSTTLCLNSFDAACGEFRWTSSPKPNRPMTGSLKAFPEHVVVNETFQYTLEIHDPDATPIFTGGAMHYFPVDDSLPPDWDPCTGHGSLTGYGAWDPPRPSAGGGTYEHQNTINRTGEWRVAFCIRSYSWPYPAEGAGEAARRFCPGDGRSHAFEGWLCHDPYSDHLVLETTITVHPAEPESE